MFLGIDYGEAHTGLAFGREGLAMPLQVVDSKNENYLLAEIVRAAVENRVEKIIMGIPTDENGKDTPQALKVRKFAKLVRIKTRRPVEFVSEYGTTSEAIESAIHSGVSKKGRRANDAYSAALILKRYFRE